VKYHTNNVTFPGCEKIVDVVNPSLLKLTACIHLSTSSKPIRLLHVLETDCMFYKLL